MKEETSLVLQKILDDAKQYLAGVNYPLKGEDGKGDFLHVQISNGQKTITYEELVENEDELLSAWEKIKRQIINDKNNG